MRPEKEYLAKEASGHLEKGDYLFLADYTGITVSETAELRDSLVKEEAEFHVVKNSALNVAAKRKEMPELGEALTGPTAIVTGGSNPSGVAKILLKFHKDKDKVVLKAGVLGEDLLSSGDIEALSKLPSIEALRAQFLGLLNTPAQQCVRVLNAVPQDILNVLDAKKRKDEEAA